MFLPLETLPFTHNICDCIYNSKYFVNLIHAIVANRHLSAQQNLVIIEQGFVYLEDLVIGLFDKIRNDHIEFIAVRQCISGLAQQITGFVQIQFERNREGYRGYFAGIVTFGAGDIAGGLLSMLQSTLS
jgi:hypothetical protein